MPCHKGTKSDELDGVVSGGEKGEDRIADRPSRLYPTVSDIAESLLRSLTPFFVYSITAVFIREDHHCCPAN